MMARVRSMLAVALCAALSRTDAAIPSLRRLDEHAADEYEFDLSSFSVRFDKCQNIKMFDGEEENAASPLIVKPLVVFRLCPSDSCGSCSSTFGQYSAEVNDYLAYTVAAQQEAFEYMCENCFESCNGNGEYCTGCGKLCYMNDNLEAQGYVNAADYIQCQQLEVQNDDGNKNGDDDNQLYIGPRCSSDGSQIVIGLFSDEDCSEPYSAQDPEDLLGMKISYHLLSHSNDDTGEGCLSCKENDENQDQNDNDADQVNEMCEELYDISAKCESKNGITNGFIQTKREDKEYENQVENENRVCTFIQSLLWNSYTESGEINVEDDQDAIVRQVTKLQTMSFSLLGVFVLCLLGSIVYINKQIEKASPRVDLSCRSDAELT